MSGQPLWALVVPAVGAVTVVVTWGRDLPVLVLVLLAVVLVGTVLTAVHHAEVVAHRVGEPFGTLILAVAVTVIEAALIVSLMASGGDDTASLARDTVFAAFMITTTGVVGICLLVGALRHGVVDFRLSGTSGALATLVSLATLCLVLPTYTTSSAGATFSTSQLAFAGVASLVLYGTYVFVQTVRHRDYFLPVGTGAGPDGVEGTADDEHAPPPSTRTTVGSLALLVLCLAGVVGMAKTASPWLERGVEDVGAPPSLVGVLIALVVLSPETAAALRAAARNRLQTSLNLALGSALASIGLTIPVIAVATIWLDGPLELGLEGRETTLLALSVVVSVLTLGTGRATVLQGVVHLSIFAAFAFLAVVP